MSLLASVNVTSLVLFAAVLVSVAISDLLWLRIPNWVVVMIAALYPAYVLSAAQPVGWQGALVLAGLVFAIGFALYSFRLLGGGDVKFLAVVALWAGPAQITAFMLSTAVIGGLLAMMATTPLRLLLPYMAAATGVHADVRQLMKLQIPYGIAIAAGGLVVAARLA